MICKNCGESTISKGKYCHSCGQKSNTHRLTLKHFIMHDIVHGLFHLDKGLPKTLKDIFIRPGTVALDYIHGKRKRYYNFFYMLLIIIGIYLFIQSVAPIVSDQENTANKSGKKVIEAIRDNRKLLIFSLIPVLAISSFITFRRLRFTFLEFFIPAVIAVIGSNAFNILNHLVLLITEQLHLKDQFHILSSLNNLFSISVFLFPMFTFAQFIKGNYSTLGKVWRLVIFYILASLIILAAVVILIIVLEGNGLFSMTAQ